MNMTAKGIDRSAAYFLSSPLNLIGRDILISILAIKKKNAVTMLIFDPDMASMCDVPVLKKSVVMFSSRPVVSPIVRALMMPGYLAPESSILLARNLLQASI